MGVIPYSTLPVVVFSRNPVAAEFAQIRHEEWFFAPRLGTRYARSDRGGNHYPRLVALSHPLLRPETSTKLIGQYSPAICRSIDYRATEIQENVPGSKTLGTRYPILGYLAQVDDGVILAPLRIIAPRGSDQNSGNNLQ